MSGGRDSMTFQVTGSIVRVAMKNFVSYKDVEVRPGPFLNVIIGPNGTGKSTLVCAICIGLAGKTSWLGRSHNAADYIKHGEEKAELEIELFNVDGDNYVVQSEINNMGNLSWRLNGSRTTKKEIESLVNSLNIQIGNLCQFLPQDKVADFAKMTPEELLENTQKAVQPLLYQQHEELKAMHVEMSKFESFTENDQVNLETEIQKNKALEGDVQNYQRRRRFEEDIQLLMKKRPWLEYEAKRLEWNEKKEGQKEKETLVISLRKESAPLMELEEKVRRLSRDVDQKLVERSHEMNDINRAANEIVKKNEREGNKIQEMKENLVAFFKEEEKRKSKATLIKNSILTLKEKLQEISENDSTAEIQPRLAEVDRQLKEIRHRTVQLEGASNNVDQELQGLVRNMNHLREQQQQLHDVQSRRLERLRQFHKPTYDAVLWLRNNTDRFRATIHEPLMLVINVKDVRNAKYIETHVSNNDKKAFVCEDPDDMELFLRIMRSEMHISVNAVQAPAEASANFNPAKPIRHYASVGFKSYLRELFTAPEPVVSYLCKMYRVHSCPVGTEKSKQNMDRIFREHPEIGLFYSENSRISSRKSKYSGENLISQSQLRQADLLTTSLDQDRIDLVKTQVQQVSNEMETKKTERRQVLEEMRSLEANTLDLTKKRKELTFQMNQKRTLQEQIQQKTRQLQQLESESLNADQFKSDMSRRIDASLRRRVSLIAEHYAKSRNQQRIGVSRSLLILKQSQHKDKLDRIQTRIREATEFLRKEEREFEELKLTCNNLKLEANLLRSKAHEACGMRPSDTTVPNELQSLFNNLPDDIEDIDKEIFELQAKADCINKIDSSKIQEFEKRRKRIEEMQAHLDRRQSQYDAQRDKMKRLNDEWRPRLDQLLAKIDRNFAIFMETLGCAGEVDLRVPVTDEVYASYGIRIKVKFRTSETLRELTAHHQSGGERAVSTVLYMMALQELTKCPFRCVDEINQGMDPVNERKIFQLVVDTACNKSQSQYFLLTPKLLANMIDECDSTKMTVLTIFNGLGMVNHKEWNLKKFLKRRRTID